MDSRYKTIKTQRLSYIPKITVKETKIPKWYIKFLRWVFDEEREIAEQDYDDEKNERLDLELSRLLKRPKWYLNHSYEYFVKEELAKLWYVVKSNITIQEIKNGIIDTQPAPKSLWRLEKFTIKNTLNPNERN